MEEAKRKLLIKIGWVLFFSIWFAYVESSVVVYLRELYYPEGFAFPIKLIPGGMGLIEIGRELATLLILLSIAFLAGKNGWTRFAYFMFSFGMWDSWYYIWLKIFISWPASFLTWDLLFLIPLPWAGPVLAPLIVSVSMIVAALMILSVDYQGKRLKIENWEWLVSIFAMIIILISFMIDASLILAGGVPQKYYWELFVIGEFLGLLVLIRGWRRFTQNKIIASDGNL